MSGPLDGVKVLELAEYAFVPASAAVLGEWGADVVKVERPQGDVYRQNFSTGRATALDFNSSWEAFNRNKRIVALDLQREAGRNALDYLIAWADVFVTNFRPQARRKLRLEPDDIFAVNPRAVYARGHGHGIKGPDVEIGGFDAVSYFARSGVGYMLSPPEGPPTRQRGAMGDAPGGLTLAGGICAGLVSVGRTGRGIIVDVSLLSFGMWQLSSDIAAAATNGVDPPRLTSTRSSNPIAGTFETNDGRVLSFTMLDMLAYLPRVARALERPDLAADSRFATFDGIAAAADELHAAFSSAIASKPLAYWVPRLKAESCIFATMASPTEVLSDPQVVANGYAISHPTHPTAKVASSPVQFDEQANVIHRRAPTKVGEHSDEVLREAGMSNEDLVRLRADHIIN